MTASLCARFLELAETAPDRPCFLVQSDDPTSGLPSFVPIRRREFAHMIEAVAKRLRACGVAPGDRVLWSLPNSLAWVALDLACQAIGAVSVIVHPATPAASLARILGESGPCIVVGNDSDSNKEGVVVIPAEEIDRLAKRGSNRTSRGFSELVDIPRGSALATVMYTSGSTGEPKGAELTLEAMCSNAALTRDALGIVPEDVFPAVLSFSHSAGRTALLHAALYAGAAVALVDRIDLQADPRIVATARPSILVVVPRVLQHLMRHWCESACSPKPFAALRLVLVGGANTTPSLIDDLERRGIRVFEAYGATEATCTITLNAPGASRRETVGRPLAGVLVKIAEDREVLCRGPNVMRGFHRDPERTAVALDPEGWLHTGDLGFLDQDGFLHLVGRKRDVFLAADGNHFAPGMLEARLESLDVIREAIVFGDGRPFVSAFVVPRFEQLREKNRRPCAPCPRRPVCNRRDRDLASCARIRRSLQEGIDVDINSGLSPSEHIKQLCVLAEPFDKAVRTTTSTAKVKIDRVRFEAEFERQIDEVYQPDRSAIETARNTFRMPLRGLMEHVASFHEKWSNGAMTACGHEDEDAPSDSFPDKPQPVDRVLSRFEAMVAEGATRFGDRTYAAHMVSALPSIGIASAALVAVLNQNQVSADASPTTTAVELQTVRWLADLVGYDPRLAGGIGTAGGSIANITALLAARNRAFPAAQADGVSREDGGAIVVSQRMHYSFRRAAELMGLGGERGLIRVPVDKTNRLSIENLMRELDRLEKTRRKVVALVGIAGTSETGNVDPLEPMAKLAAERQIWFHVDAAMGGAALASGTCRPRFAGIERADSVTVDPHKWFYVPYHCAYVLFRDRSLMRHVELSDSHFVVLRTEEPDLGKWSIEGSRAANALKFWIVAQSLGKQGYGALVDRQVELTVELAAMVDAAENLERLSVPELNILCFRFVPPSWRRELAKLEPRCSQAIKINERIDAINVDIWAELASSRRSLLSRTTLESTLHAQPVVSLRAVLFHPAIERDDLQLLVRTVGEAGTRVTLVSEASCRQAGSDLP